MHQIISFPHLGNYHIPIAYLARAIFPDAEIRIAPPMTKKTLELGSRHSPDFVCVPFKYNVGNFIEALEGGANILIQTGGGCRFGYFGELQEQILKDLGYEFEFLCLARDDASIPEIYKNIRRLGSPLTLPQFAGAFGRTLRMVRLMDKFEVYIRENIGFETKPGTFETLYNQFLEEAQAAGSVFRFTTLFHKYDKLFRAVETEKPEDVLRVGIVGELYTQMEPFANYFVEKELAKSKIAVQREMNITFLVMQKWHMHQRLLHQSGKYLKYHIGADGTTSVARSKKMAEQDFDGLIHMKPFGCTPEINAMPALQNVGKDYKIPILYFSFDSQTSETGIKTRLEAFTDMIQMRREKQGA